MDALGEVAERPVLAALPVASVYVSLLVIVSLTYRTRVLLVLDGVTSTR